MGKIVNVCVLKTHCLSREQYKNQRKKSQRRGSGESISLLKENMFAAALHFYYSTLLLLHQSLRYLFVRRTIRDQIFDLYKARMPARFNIE